MAFRAADITANLRRVLVVALAAAALVGCGMHEDVDMLMVDPSRYEGYHCNDLVVQWKALLAREKNLRELMARAGEGGGAVIATLTYRSQYDTVLGEKKVLQRTAAEKNCVLVSAYQSDQTIR